MAVATLARRVLPTPLVRAYRVTVPYHKSAAFLGGFLYDSLTLRRVDRWFDILVLSLYLTLLTGLLILGERLRDPTRDGWLSRRRQWVEVAIRFFFGGLFSAYVVYYFKSTHAGTTYVFLALLLALLVGNEYLEQRLHTQRLQPLLHYFCAFSFFLYLTPVLTGWLGFGVFLIAGGLALGLGTLTAALSHLGRPTELKTLLWQRGPAWLLLFATLGLLYQLNLIPPVPLSLQFAGIYHRVERQGEHYALTRVAPAWYDLFSTDDRDFLHQPGDRACAFTAIFAPSGLQVGVRHHWAHWDAEQTRWQQTDVMPFAVRGGREAGYRVFSCKARLAEGRWRVTVRAETEQDLGRIDFEVRTESMANLRWHTRSY